MRLSLIPWTCGVAALVATPAFSQHRLPARPFEFALTAAAPSAAPLAPEWWRRGGPRIRPQDPRATALLRNGVERSAHVRALIDTIDVADVVVYMDVERGMDTSLAGRLTFIGKGGAYRYVRVSINASLNGDFMIASLAHELQHVVEVIEHPEVTSEATLKRLYQRIGLSNRATGTEGWETRAAQEMTREVRRELSSAAVASVARRESPRMPTRDDRQEW